MMKTKAAFLSCLLALNSVPGVLFAQLIPGGKDYFIEAGDVLNVKVFPADEFSREVTVRPDGTIDVPLLGAVKVAGMLSSELEARLTSKFAKYVSDPRITINVRKFSADTVAIIGESKGTGYFTYREGMKLLDLVADAGGLADYPKASKVRIYRRVKGEDGEVREEVIKADLAAVMDGRMEHNIPLVAGDIVYVPRTKFYKAGKWLTDNIVPWVTLLTAALTLSLVSRD